MAEIDIQDLFHKCQGQAPEKRERITEQLPESDRAVLLKLLESDAELESDDDFLQPVTLPESTDIQTPELENTATLSESGTSRDVGYFPEQIGDYRILNVIAVHGQGIVYRADHTGLNRQVVIKVVQDQLNESARASLVEEGRALASLSHPNIAQIYDLTMHDGNPCLVMEYIDGRNLAELHMGSPMPPAEAAKLVRMIAHGMEHAHASGIIHRDLKPANVVMRATDKQPKVIDFGLARARHAYAAESEGSSYGGTIAYMPPEQANWVLQYSNGEAVEDPTDERTDVFAIGAILYSLLTGKKLYSADTKREGLEKAIACDFDRDALEQAGTPSSLQKICLKAMATEPGDRYRTAADFAAALNTEKKSSPVPWIVAGTLTIAIGILLATILPNIGKPRETNNTSQSTASTNSTIVLPAQQPEINFTHYRYPKGSDGGVSYPLLSSPGVFEDDDLDLDIKFADPVYCFVFALNPDGAIQLCYPEEGADHVAESSITQLKYPSVTGQTFGFTDGPGQQVFMVAWSNEPLPSFTEWSAGRIDAKNIVQNTDGRWLWQQSDLAMWPTQKRATRGAARESRALEGANTFTRLCKELADENTKVYALTFPVTAPK